MELLIAVIIAALILWLGSEPESLRDQSERLAGRSIKKTNKAG